MIALHPNTIFVLGENGRRVPFDSKKLARSLNVAAARAGNPFWQLAEHVAAAVRTYLEDDWPTQTIRRDQLFESVIDVLCAIGHPEIAQAYRQMHNHAVIDLAELALETTSGFELEFFQMLNQRLERLSAAGQSRLQFRNLRYCVKILRGKQRWRSQCENLSDEVLAFIRQKLAVAAPERACSFVVAG